MYREEVLRKHWKIACFPLSFLIGQKWYHLFKVITVASGNVEKINGFMIRRYSRKRKVLIGDKTESKPWILAPNHISLWDPLIMGVVIFLLTERPVYFLARESYFRKGFGLLGVLMRWLGIFPVEGSGREALKYGLKALNKGYIIGVYPEGTRCYRLGEPIRNDRVPGVKEGIIFLSISGKASILPVSIYFRKKKKGFFKNIGREVRIFFYEPYNPDKEMTRNELAEELMGIIASHHLEELRGKYG